MFSKKLKHSVISKSVSAISILMLVVGIFPTPTLAATISTESFGTGPTSSTVSGWTEGGDGAESRAAGSGNDSASLDGDRFAVVFGKDGTICRSFTTTGFTNVKLSYYWRGDSDSGDSSDDGIVEFKAGSSCSGSGWTQLQNHDMRQDSSWTTQAAFTNAGFNNTTFVLRFRTDTNHSDENFRVDGIAVTGDSLDNTPPTVTGLTNDATPKKTKTWSWSASETSTYRFVIDQIAVGTPPGAYGSTNTATQGSGDGAYYIHVQAKDTAGNESAVVTVSVLLDNTAPTIAEVTPVPTPDNDATPNYTFSSNEAGAITYAGGCTSGTSAAASGNTIVTFNTLAQGMYGGCTIKVSDTAGNASSLLAVAPFTVDLTAPVITILGSNPTPLGTGDTYTEAGANATDNVDASVPVVTTGSVNTAVPGTYNISYSATDVAGNASTVQRAVNVSDDDAPAITGTPSDIVAEALDALGALVNFVLPTASDNVDGNVPVSCNWTSPSMFPITSFPMTISTVSCSASDTEGNTAFSSFNVTVQDTTAPVITLVGSTPVDVNVGDSYVDAGATASDTVDGEITANIATVNPVNTAVPGSYSVTYDVSDASGNSATQVTRTVNIHDVVAPVIALNGDASMQLNQNDTYSEPGATATDDVDPVVTVTIGGSVHTAVPGTYTVTYDATDSSANAAAQVTRTVIVISSGNGPVAGSLGGQVLGASIVIPPPADTKPEVKEDKPETTSSKTEEPKGEVLGAACSKLDSYLGRGKNDSGAVKMLQEFLNKEMGSKLEVNGIYDAATIAVVKEFQLKYVKEILMPWVPFGLSGDKPTGIVYKTTQRMINMLSCPGTETPMPALP